MTDLLWNDVKDRFDPDWAGLLPDVVVPSTSADDWQALFDLVAASGWQRRYHEGGTEAPLPRAATVLARPVDAEYAELWVWPMAEILAIFRFYSAQEITFDVDVRELQGQQRLDTFCGFLAAIGRCLGKPVLMYSEGGTGHTRPLLGYDLDGDRVMSWAPDD